MRVAVEEEKGSGAVFGDEGVKDEVEELLQGRKDSYRGGGLAGRCGGDGVR